VLFLPIVTEGFAPSDKPFKLPSGGHDAGMNSDYLVWAVVPVISAFESLVFGVGGLFNLLVLISLSASTPSKATYGVQLACLQACTLAGMFLFLGMFARRSDTDRPTEGYPYAHSLYQDLIRIMGYAVALLFACFQLYSMCLKSGFLGDKGITSLLLVVGVVCLVPFKLLYNDGEPVMRGDTVGFMWWIFPIAYVSVFVLIFADLIIAADGSPIASNVYFAGSCMLGYLAFTIVFTLYGAFATAKETSAFNRYTPAIKAIILLAIDMLVFGFLVYGTAFAAAGHPFRDTQFFLTASDLVAPTLAPTAAPTAAVVY